MKIEVQLFGAFREFCSDVVVLDLPSPTRADTDVDTDADADTGVGAATRMRVQAARAALCAHAQAHWQGFDPGLLARSVFASETEILRDADVIPADGRLAVLPPVNGG